jgi:hypothetical protein
VATDNDAADSGQWLTYAEIAARFGKAQPAATQLVRRRKWKKQQTNHPHDLARFWVPDSAVIGMPAPRVATGTAKPADDIDTRAWKKLCDQLDREVARTDTAEKRVGRLENELANLRQDNRARDAWGLGRRLRWALWGG